MKGPKGRRCLWILLAFTLMTSCTRSEKSRQDFNHLSEEKSPYLRQHADNPVWWNSWGERALRKAEKENKLIFLSIGYSTCHWCHVMERESFSDPTVAAALNRSFVAIKVDREERPDVDAIYMDAVQAMTGSGGWPLNVILTPDRKPFFGGTYFPKAGLLDVLSQISKTWSEEPDKIKEVGVKLTGYLKNQETVSNAGDFENQIFTTFFTQFAAAYDPEHGGHRGSPKFPPSYELRVLLRIYRRTGDADALKMVRATLDRIARGGVYDHIGGGFHRYSTDEHWLVPHFEKMLYDQAALVNAYIEAYQVTKDPEYKRVVEETLDYVLRDMTSPEGAFYSAEDADSEGVEGKFYVWKESELRAVLTPAEFSQFAKAYGVTKEGNFEGHQNILSLQNGFFRARRSKVLETALGKLRKVRSTRVRPSRDEKILTSWNGLMIAAMAKAGWVLDNPRYVQGATRAADFVLSHAKASNGSLLHRWISGEAAVAPYDEDYAFLIHGLIEVYEATFDAKWFKEALRLQQEQDRLLWDAEKGGYFLTSEKDPDLLRRGKNYLDNVVPSGNSISVLNLLKLANLKGDRDLIDRAVKVSNSFPEQVKSYPSAFSQLLMALDFSLDQSKEVAVISTSDRAKTDEMVRAVREDFLPNQVVAVGREGAEDVPLLKNRPPQRGKPTAYVCVHQVCQLPTTDPQVAKKQVAAINRFSLR